FPLLMIGATLVFFSEKWHARWQDWFRRRVFNTITHGSPPGENFFLTTPNLPGRHDGKCTRRLVLIALLFHFAFQILFPWRFLLYPGNVFWTEQGYRFAWRVMLMEKAGTATFYVKDDRTGREGEVVNRDFLNAHQEKQMAMQPDMILQFARFLEKYYAAKGVQQPAVRAEVYVTLNARPSRLLFDPQMNLTKVRSTRELFEP
ncbi:MAG: HTTM domain-containing protein, partial [Saprospiraceae bacterium]